MQRPAYLTEIVLSNKITKNRIVLSFKDSPRKPLRRPPCNASLLFPSAFRDCFHPFRRDLIIEAHLFIQSRSICETPTHSLSLSSFLSSRLSSRQIYLFSVTVAACAHFLGGVKPRGAFVSYKILSRASQITVNLPNVST